MTAPKQNKKKKEKKPKHHKQTNNLPSTHFLVLIHPSFPELFFALVMPLLGYAPLQSFPYVAFEGA
jgi:hypothetical protein